MKRLARGILEKALPKRVFTPILARRSRRYQAGLLKQTAVTGLTEAFVAAYGLAVRYGPFRDLTYTDAACRDRIITPKLLGTYELELHDVIRAVQNSRYEYIIDIGCAEGYYTTGFALTTRSRIIGYDAEPQELRLARHMAVRNGVTSRVEYRSWCGPRDLLNLQRFPRVFVISDCEGFETELFRRDVIHALRGADMLIELHGDAESLLPGRFCETHEIHLIRSVSREQVTRVELANFSEPEQRLALDEFRNAPQTWLIATSKGGASANVEERAFRHAQIVDHVCVLKGHRFSDAAKTLQSTAPLGTEAISVVCHQPERAFRHAFTASNEIHKAQHNTRK